MEAKATEPADKPTSPIPSPGISLPDKTCQPGEVANLKNVIQESIRASNEPLEKEPLSTIPIQSKTLEASALGEASDRKVQYEVSSTHPPTVDNNLQRNDPITDDATNVASKDLPVEKDDGVSMKTSRDASEAPSRKSSIHAAEGRTKKKKTMGKRITETLAAIGFKKKNSKKEQKSEEDSVSAKSKSFKSKKGSKTDDNESEVVIDLSQDATSPGQYWQSEDPAVKTVINLEEHMKSEKNSACLQESIVDSASQGISKLSTDLKSKADNSQGKAEYSALATHKDTKNPIETTTINAVITSNSFKSTFIAQEEKHSMTSSTLGEVILDPPTRQMAETIDLDSDSVKEILSNVIDVTSKKSGEVTKSGKDEEAGQTLTHEHDDSSENELLESLLSKHISERVTGSIIHGVNLLEIFHADGSQKNEVIESDTLQQKSAESVVEPGKKVEENSSSNMEYMQDDHCFDSQRASSTTFLHDHPHSNKSNEELASASEADKEGKGINNKEMDDVRKDDVNRN